MASAKFSVKTGLDRQRKLEGSRPVKAGVIIDVLGGEWGDERLRSLCGKTLARASRRSGIVQAYNVAVAPHVKRMEGGERRWAAGRSGW